MPRRRGALFLLFIANAIGASLVPLYSNGVLAKTASLAGTVVPLAALAAFMISLACFRLHLSREQLEELSLTVLSPESIARTVVMRPVLVYLIQLLPWVALLVVLGVAASFEVRVVGRDQLMRLLELALMLAVLAAAGLLIGVSSIVCNVPRRVELGVCFAGGLFSLFWRSVAGFAGLAAVVMLANTWWLGGGIVPAAMLFAMYLLDLRRQVRLSTPRLFEQQRREEELESFGVSLPVRTPTLAQWRRGTLLMLLVLTLALTAWSDFTTFAEARTRLTLLPILAAILLPGLMLTALRYGFDDSWRGLGSGRTALRIFFHPLAMYVTILPSAVVMLLAMALGSGVFVFVTCGMLSYLSATWFLCALYPRRGRAWMMLFALGLICYLVFLSTTGWSPDHDWALQFSMTSIPLYFVCLLPWVRERFEHHRRRELLEGAQPDPAATAAGVGGGVGGAVALR